MTPHQRASRFCARFGLGIPILEAPMAGACPPELAISVANAGGMGAAGVLLDSPEAIANWVERFRAGSSGAFQLNVWVPDPPSDDHRRIEAAREFLSQFGPPGTSGPPAPAFAEQCEAILAARPSAVSSIMGLFDETFVGRVHQSGSAWFACATTLDEALAAQAAGADAIVAQGMEAGGHRGSFDPDRAEGVDVGLFALLPRLADHLDVPIIATGGIADGRGVAAALALGASAVQIGTALLRSPEAAIAEEWSQSLVALAPEQTVLTRAYSGRLGRAVPTAFVLAWAGRNGVAPAPYPYQRRLLGQWRRGPASGVDRVNQWAGQNCALARPQPAGEIVSRMWEQAQDLMA